jgi:hypothetical protein
MKVTPQFAAYNDASDFSKLFDLESAPSKIPHILGVAKQRYDKKLNDVAYSKSLRQMRNLNLQYCTDEFRKIADIGASFLCCIASR